MGKTLISWATRTVNVVSGCSKPAAHPPAADLVSIGGALPVADKWRKSETSPECVRCYAETLSLRRGWSKGPWTEENAPMNVRLRPERINEFGGVKVKDTTLPPSQRERMFVCSMGDIFHELVPDEFIHRVFAALVKYPHIYQMLTKRTDRAASWPGPWPDHIWLGTTCGHPETKWRIEYLRQSKAKVRFVSAEPLLGSLLPLNLDGIDQVIVGGESGEGWRKMDMAWAREIRDECVRTKTAFFFKQDAAYNTEKRCYLVEEDGRCMQYRQFPGELSAPVEVQPDNPKWHAEQYRLNDEQKVIAARKGQLLRLNQWLEEAAK